MDHYRKPHAIISGGQRGADHGGLVAAALAGICTGGWAPKGFRTEAGPDPSLREFGLSETDTADYRKRTLANIQDSDATVLLASNPDSAGSKQTLQFAKNAGKPILTVDPFAEDASAQIATFLRLHRPLTVNVAGNRESVCPGIFAQTVAVLGDVFRSLATGATPGRPASSHAGHERRSKPRTPAPTARRPEPEPAVAEEPLRLFAF